MSLEKSGNEKWKLSGIVERRDSETNVVLFENGESAGERGNGVLLGEGIDHVTERGNGDRSEEMGRKIEEMAKSDGRGGGGGGGRRGRGGEKRGGEGVGGEGMKFIEKECVAELVIELEKGEIEGVRGGVRENVHFEFGFEELKIETVKLRTIGRGQNPTKKKKERAKPTSRSDLLLRCV